MRSRLCAPLPTTQAPGALPLSLVFRATPTTAMMTWHSVCSVSRPSPSSPILYNRATRLQDRWQRAVQRQAAGDPPWRQRRVCRCVARRHMSTSSPHLACAALTRTPAACVSSAGHVAGPHQQRGARARQGLEPAGKVSLRRWEEMMCSARRVSPVPISCVARQPQSRQAAAGRQGRRNYL